MYILYVYNRYLPYILTYIGNIHFVTQCAVIIIFRLKAPNEFLSDVSSTAHGELFLLNFFFHFPVWVCFRLSLNDAYTFEACGLANHVYSDFFLRKLMLPAHTLKLGFKRRRDEKQPEETPWEDILFKQCGATAQLKKLGQILVRGSMYCRSRPVKLMPAPADLFHKHQSVWVSTQSVWFF